MGFFWQRTKVYKDEKLKTEKELKKEEEALNGLFLTGENDILEVNRQQALNIPSIGFGINFITDTIAGLEIKLYKVEDNKVIEVKNDKRLRLLNDDTGDILTGFQLKKAVLEDFLLEGSGHIYINKKRNEIKSLHYVEANEISVLTNNEPIFKDIKISVRGEEYNEFDFVNVTRKSKNGVTGLGIVEEHNVILSTVYNSIIFENSNMLNGGIKKGVIKSQKKLTEQALNTLKESWKKLYGKKSTETCVILNDGLDYKELQQTFVEMQLLENKKLNSRECCKLLTLPPNLIEEEFKEDIYNGAIKTGVIPVINSFLSAINKSLLLEKEKDSYYFGVETKGLLKGDIEKRYKAYEIGIKNGFLKTNEVRYEEDLPEVEGFDYLRLSLGEVLYNTKTKEIYTPNTGQSKEELNNLKGGEFNEN